MSVEDLEDDQKLVVRFVSVGNEDAAGANYAKLERVRLKPQLVTVR